MANPSRDKGTGWESELAPDPGTGRTGILQHLFGPQVTRAALRGVHDYGDFLRVPWLHEAKATEKPRFQLWARINTKKAGNAWVTLWHGDRRKPGNGPLVIMPIELYELLINVAQDNGVDLWAEAEALKETI